VLSEKQLVFLKKRSHLVEEKINQQASKAKAIECIELLHEACMNRIWIGDHP